MWDLLGVTQSKDDVRSSGQRLRPLLPSLYTINSRFSLMKLKDKGFGSWKLGEISTIWCFVWLTVPCPAQRSTAHGMSPVRQLLPDHTHPVTVGASAQTKFKAAPTQKRSQSGHARPVETGESNEVLQVPPSVE